MCGRFTRKYTWQQIHDFLNLRPPARRSDGGQPDLGASFNVAPTQSAPIVRAATRDVALARWGLVPAWAKDESIGSRLINARAETLAEKPAFRSAFKSCRCIVPISGFYEWQSVEGSRTKQPWYFTRADGEIMLLAGLHEQKGELETFTIITTEANDFSRRFHDRMPAILEREEVDAWLSAETPDPAALLHPARDGILTAHPVSTRINTPRHDDEQLIQPVEPGPAAEPDSLFG